MRRNVPHVWGWNWRRVAGLVLLPIVWAVAVNAALAPMLEVSPSTIRPGQLVTARGSGFRPFEEVSITVTPEGREAVSFGTLEADAQGNITMTVNVPSDVPPGIYYVTATATSGQATTPVQVLAEGQPDGLDEGEAPTASLSDGAARYPQGISGIVPRVVVILVIAFSIIGGLLAHRRWHR